MDEPKVSAVIPVYNRPHKLVRAVDSALGQDCGDLEVLVVDDASTDETPAVVEHRWDEPVRLLRHGERRGAAAARNTGIKAARGEYVAFLDSDDAWRPRNLCLQIAALENSPGAACAFGGWESLSTESEEVLHQQLPDRRVVTREQELAVDRIGPTSTVVARRDAIEESSARFDCKLPSRQDWDFWIQLLRAGPAVSVQQVVVSKWVGHEQISRSLHRIIDGTERVIDKYEEEMTDLGPEFGRQLAWLARAQMNYSLSRGWRTAIRALKYRPWEYKLWLALLASLLGRKAYQRAFSAAYRLAGNTYLGRSEI